MLGFVGRQQLPGDSTLDRYVVLDPRLGGTRVQTMDARSEAVRLTDVSKRYALGASRSITALNGVSLSVFRGSVVALAGPSGSGKSTLLHVIGALERPDSGTVVVGERDLATLQGKRLAQHRRGVGFVFQRFNLLPALTVLDNVLAPVLPYRTDYDKAARAAELLALVGLQGRERSMPAQLSGGQQQRVAIARALVSTPALLLADEPTGNLDSRTGREIIALLLTLRDEQGVTIVLATHDPVIAARSDRVVTLLDGRITDDVAVDSDVDIAALLGAVQSS